MMLASCSSSVDYNKIMLQKNKIKITKKVYLLALDFLPVIFLNVSPLSFVGIHNEPLKMWSCLQNCYRHPDQFGAKSCLSNLF